MLSFLVLIVAFITFTNYLSLIRKSIDLKFWSIFGLDLVLIVILLIYDTVVIDWLVIGHWRPTFLQLPDIMDKEQMVEHIRRTFIAGPLFALLLAALSAGATVLIW
jgi:membrane-associated PAP2 superfamily phosphatase